jgi:hypothetical protein
MLCKLSLRRWLQDKATGRRGVGIVLGMLIIVLGMLIIVLRGGFSCLRAVCGGVCGGPSWGSLHP